MNDMAVEFKRYSFTVSEYHHLFEAGVLDDRARVELIDGELIEMPPIGGTSTNRNPISRSFRTIAGDTRGGRIPHPIDSSFAYDFGIIAMLYARSGILDYLLVHVQGKSAFNASRSEPRRIRDHARSQLRRYVCLRKNS